MPILDYADDDNRRALWSWQTRVGLAPKWGTTSVYNYQREHALISDELERRAILAFPAHASAVFCLRARANWIEAQALAASKWLPLGTFDEIFRYLRNRP